MSASYLVDLSKTTLMGVTIPCTLLSGVWPGSGAVVGAVVDCLHANTYTNVQVTTGLSPSGQIRVAVQTSDATTSGSFTNPMSGMADLPQDFMSGGVLMVNSGGGLFAAQSVAGGFLTPHRYVRAIALSGYLFEGGFSVTIVKQLKESKISGFQGYSWSPANSGQTINV